MMLAGSAPGVEEVGTWSAGAAADLLERAAVSTLWKNVEPILSGGSGMVDTSLVLLKQNQLDVLLMVNKRMEQEITAAKTALTNTMHGASELIEAKRVLKARNQQLQTRVDQLQAKFNAAQADCCAAQVLAAGLQRQLDAKGSCACGVLSQRSGVDTGDVCKSLSEEASFAAEGLDSKIQVELNAKNGCACIVLSPQRPAVSKRAQELCLDIEGIECDQDASEVPQAHPTSPKQRQPVGTLSTHGDGAHAASSTCDGLVAEAAFMQPEDSPIRDEI